MQAREIRPDEHDAWNQLLVAAPEGNVFARTDWLEMLCRTDPTLSILRLGCFDGQSLVGGQILCHKRMWGLDLATEFEFFYSGPFVLPSRKTGLFHQVSRRFQVVSVLADALDNGLAELHWEAHPALRDARPFIYAGWDVRVAYAHIWRLADVEATWMGMNREKRREIKAAQARYHFAQENTRRALDAFLQLYRASMLKFAWWPSQRWEDQLRERFQWMIARDGCRLYTARTQEGKLVAGCLVLLSREDHAAYLWRQGSAEAHQRQGVVPALYWHAAATLADEFHSANLGGSPSPTLSLYKDYLGAEVVPHYCISRNNQPIRLAMARTAQVAKDKVHSLGMRAIQRLPSARDRKQADP
jgi:ribosomal protein S18 acetylase RimI-like enzyme